jgi:Protein of unknown function (DUF3221)
MQTTRFTTLFALTLAALFGGCSKDPSPDDDLITPPGADNVLQLPSSQPEMRGIIAAVQPGDSVRPGGTTSTPDSAVSCPPSCGEGVSLRNVLIDELPGQQGYLKVRATALAGATILERVDGEMRALGFSDLRAGMEVEVWFDGPVAESYPGQGTLKALVVVRR